MAAIKMDELLVSWLGSDDVYEKVLNLIESHRAASSANSSSTKVKESLTVPTKLQRASSIGGEEAKDEPSIPDNVLASNDRNSNLDVIIPTFFTPQQNGQGRSIRIDPNQQEWNELESKVNSIFSELGIEVPSSGDENRSFLDEKDETVKALTLENFSRITKEICSFPSFFNGPLYRRILLLYNMKHTSSGKNQAETVTLPILKEFWDEEMQHFDASDRFFRLVKQPDKEFITRDDFLPFIEELLMYHPGLEFLHNHAEFQEKYAVTVITRIFYSVNTCHNGKITSRQIRKSDLLQAFHAVDEEEDINKITRYFSYEHFYVLYCRFWELDHDRDYKITREDLLKYGDHSLSHLIVDRIFDAADRPFGINPSTADNPNASDNSASSNRDYLSYEDFIFFMLSEEDKSNEISVRYWFNCLDVDGDGKLNNMEMRSFYAVQLHRMQCLGHEIVPFEDMLCQMIDMIKPESSDYFVVDDFLQSECINVSGALFEALFNLNKYLQFETRDPFLERQKREDEFDCDWDRFASIDYHRLAMEEEAREEEAMEIDWVTVDDDDDDGDDFNMGLGGASEAPF